MQGEAIPLPRIDRELVVGERTIQLEENIGYDLKGASEKMDV